MVATTLSQSILAGMDPSVIRNIQNIENGEQYLKAGQDASPTTSYGALGRLANALAGTYIQNSSTSDLAKTIAGGRKSAQDQLLAAIEAQTQTKPAPVPSAGPALAPQALVNPGAAPPPSLAPTPPTPVPGSPNAQVADRFPADWSPGTAASPLPNNASSPLDTAAYPQGPVGAPSQVAAAGGGNPGYGNAISNIESGGRYDLLGPVTKTGDRAFGKYQVMGANVPEWTQAILGKRMSPQEFLANPQAQDAVFQGKFGEYAQKYGPEGAAKAWFAGEGGMHNPNARDQLGTTVQSYADQFTRGLAGQPGPQAIAAAAGGRPSVASDADEEASAKPGQQVAQDTSHKIDVHQLLGVLQHPYADETTKALASKLLLQELAPKEDEFASSPQGIFNKRTGELKQGGASPDDAVYGGLQGKELLTAVQQKEPGIAARAVSILEGKTPYPTSSRVNSDDNRLKKIVAQIDPTFEGGTSKARMKMQSDLSSSGNSNMGGILSNGKSSFSHLADASDKMADLGNYNGPNVPGGGHVAAAGNYIGNVIAPSSETKAKQTAINDNLLKYGQESTKFYAGSGGGEAERMNAMKTLNPAYASSNEQAAYLRTEKGLMLDRLTEKERQIRDVMGPDYLEKHPVMTPELQKHVDRIDKNIARLEGTEPAEKGGAASPAASASASVPDRAAIEAEMRKRKLLQ